MHIRENQQLENRHFKPFSAVLFLTPHFIKPPKILKLAHQRKKSEMVTQPLVVAPLGRVCLVFRSQRGRHDLDPMALWKTVIRSSDRLFVLQHGTVLSETCSRYGMQLFTIYPRNCSYEVFSFFRNNEYLLLLNTQ